MARLESVKRISLVPAPMPRAFPAIVHLTLAETDVPPSERHPAISERETQPISFVWLAACLLVMLCQELSGVFLIDDEAIVLRLVRPVICANRYAIPVRIVPIGVVLPHEWLGNPAITTAILERILHKSEVIKQSGDSFRLKHRKTIFGDY